MITRWGFEIDESCLECSEPCDPERDEVVQDPWGAGPPRTIPIRRGTFMSGRRRGSKRVALSTRMETRQCR